LQEGGPENGTIQEERMKILKRILAVVLMLMSVLLGLLSIGGIVGSWSLSNSLTDGLVTVLSGADRILGTTEGALSRLENRVGTARDEVTSFEEAVVGAAEDFVEKPVVLTALSERLDLGIGPAVSNLRDTVQEVRETLIGIQNAIEAVNALPFVSLGEDLPGAERLAKLSEGATALSEGLQAMRDGVREAKAEAAAEVVLRVGKATARVDVGLEAIETATTGMAGQVSETRSEIAAFQARATLWLDLGAVALTVLFLWLLFAHVVTFLVGLSLLRDKNLFERWLGGPAPLQVAPPVDEVPSVEPVEPMVVVEREEPAEALEPVEPEEPEELAEAAEPVEPEEPEEPAEATEPVEPVEPEEEASGES
jgi:hypothetical protein